MEVYWKMPKRPTSEQPSSTMSSESTEPPQATTTEKYPIIVAQFDLPGHPRRTEHWNLMVLISATHYHTYELRGNMDTFTYIHDEELRLPPVRANAAYRGGCHIGDIPATPEHLQWLDTRLSKQCVVKWDAEWDGQDWVIEAMRMLKDEGLVFPNVSARSVRKDLEEDMERWNEGDDTADERLFSAAGEGESQ